MMMINKKLEIGLITLILCVLSASCKKDDSSREIENLNGKYSILKAIADKKVDVNLDGISSDDLLKEIPALKASNLELKTKNVSNSIFSQSWQNQSFQHLNPDQLPPENYNPDIFVIYVNQPTIANFSIENNQLILSRDFSAPEFPLPTKVEIVDQDHIRILLSKRIYTRSGMTNVMIQVLYEKFSTEF